ncbi:MAG: HlyC/CorC family transporter [Pirellulales bacterium]|nr:HlyC/CorC family transporter [Pirellulales bacterium]
MWLLVLSVAGALLISALCSLMEATLLSLRPGQIAAISGKRPGVGQIWRRLKSNIERPIAAILILNTTAHTIGASVAGSEYGRLYGDKGIWIFSLVFTFLMLQFTEILPKGAGVRYNRIVAVWIARPLALLVRVMRPVQMLVHLINVPFSGGGAKKEALSAADEITALSRFAQISGEISAEQEHIIRRAARLAHIKVRDVMRPRVDIDALDIDTPPEEIVGAVAVAGFARVPIYEGDLDHIFGFVYIKDLLLEIHMGRPIDLRALARPALLVPETSGLDRLLELFRQNHTQMAIVLDEHGGTEGLVTIEDVLEEIAGTIYDEHHDEEGEEIVPQSETSWLVSGLTTVDNLLEAVGQPELRGKAPSEVSTVAGLVQSLLDRIAKPGDRTTWQGLTLEVVDLDGLRIDHVLVSVNGEWGL